ncbi:MAG: histidinol-phosphatase [Clostridia bacterium]|nr:histidinol-phosphatase [Clostridia bacterium]
MKILSNCHTHTTYCDGRSPAEETVLAALGKGFRSLGFTSHAPQHFDLPYAVSPDRERDYIREIRALGDKYRSRITIRCGIERDLFSCADVYPYDYFIASVHYLPCGTDMPAVDGSPDHLKDAVRGFYSGSGMRAVRAYYSLLAAYARAWRPPVIGHFDLIKKNNAVLGLFDENDPAYMETVHDALKAIRDAGSLLEVNTGGMARNVVREPYPSAAILKMWHSMGGGVTVSSDCHDARFLDYAFDTVPDFLAEAGFDRVFVLGTGQALWEEVPLDAPAAPAFGADKSC